MSCQPELVAFSALMLTVVLEFLCVTIFGNSPSFPFIFLLKLDRGKRSRRVPLLSMNSFHHRHLCLIMFRLEGFGFLYFHRTSTAGTGEGSLPGLPEDEDLGV